MQVSTRCIALVGALALSLGASPLTANENAAKGRELLARHGNAVVTVRLAMKVRVAMEGREEQEEESTKEVLATLLDPRGLAVCSLTDADPSLVAEQMMADRPNFKMQMDITDLKLRLADGKELPAKIVLRDRDLDLAFVRAMEVPAQPLPAIDLATSAATDLLEDVFVLSRLNETANRAPAVALDSIGAIIQKPRLMYVPNTQSGDLGCPVFDTSGRVIGILVNRFPPTMSRTTDSSQAPLVVILPAADVLEVMKQVQAAP